MSRHNRGRVLAASLWVLAGTGVVLASGPMVIGPAASAPSSHAAMSTQSGPGEAWPIETPGRMFGAGALTEATLDTGTPEAPNFDPSSLLVRFRAGTTADERDGVIAKAGGGRIEREYTLVPGLVHLRIDPARHDQILAALRADPSVMYAERDWFRFAMNQTLPPGVSQVQGPLVWALGHRGAGVRVSVLDTGVDLTHPDLPATVASASFISGQDVQDLHGHGTHCSGTVLALDNSFGVVGVAPSADLMIGKVLSNSGSGSDASVTAGIEWSVLNGAKVISMSLGSTAFSQALNDACLAAFQANVVLAGAAGNSNSSTPSYPGSSPGVINVAAVDFNNNRASFSNFGPTITIAAPGVNILSTTPPTQTLVSSVSWNSSTRSSAVLTGSGTGTVTAQTVWCGFGGSPADFPPEVSGNIAAIRRGGTDGAGNTLTFAVKANNALAAGAVAVIIANNTGTGPVTNGTLGGSISIPVVSVNQSDGNTLQDGPLTATVSVTTQSTSLYGNSSGTSMATPHVAGVAALLWSAFPDRNVTSAQIVQAITSSALDLGAPGRDDIFGHGLVQARAAVDALDALTAPPLACNPADIAQTDGAPGADGLIDNGDFSLFISAFFSAFCPAGGPVPCNEADIAQTDGSPGADGQVDNGDFSLFVTSFFGADCNP
jgi:serine protease